MRDRGTDPRLDFAEPAPATVITVSELLMRASNALEAEFGTVAVEGEISSYNWVQRSGHMYWTLKDAASQVECAMFKSDNQRLRFRLVDGERVVVIGRPQIYRVRGRFQLVVSDVLPQGRGALWLRFEELKRKLAAEGLFAAERKRPLPFWPRAVGVVTSSDGAALRDICTVIGRRAPATRLLLKAVPVQGREAAPEIARAIRWFARNAVAEILIVGRGGGSLEDLWAFNEEIVVRAIVESPIPIVSAVGHETDTTLADYAADLRAPTPSAAGERVVPETRAIARAVVGGFQRLARAVERQRVRRLEETLAPIRRYGFRRVRDRLRESRQRWGEGADALAPPLEACVDDARLRLAEARAALPDGPARKLADGERGLAAARALPRELGRRRERVRTRSAHAAERLQAASPLAILERGYAVVTGPDGAVLREATAVATGERLRVRLARGALGAEVTDIESEEER
ncbi:MAG TPA: exodeoxyribonuclease VII large subunit [Gemmatimonadota bacterium]|nr:exodeoxyribonuclease VII large subunit [Gemmatimonadota bacterium]